MLAQKAGPEHYVVSLGSLLCIARGPLEHVSGSCFTVLFATHGGFRLMIGDELRGNMGDRAVVPPQTRFALEDASAPVLQLFLDADGRAGTRLRYATDGIERRGSKELMEAGWRLIEAPSRANIDNARFESVISRLVFRLDTSGPHVEGDLVVVRQITASMRAALPSKLASSTLSAQFRRSPDQLSALLRRTTGLSLRAFGQWLRLVECIRLWERGHALDQAARATGHTNRRRLTEMLTTLFGLDESDLGAVERWSTITSVGWWTEADVGD